MVFNRRLAAIAQTFIDGVIGGGAFVSAHLRRGDFLFAHPDAIPPIRDTARQLRAALDAANSNKLFIATDARDDDLEFPQLQAWLPEVEIFLWPAGRVASLEWPNRSAPSVRSPPLTEYAICVAQTPNRLPLCQPARSAIQSLVRGARCRRAQAPPSRPPVSLPPHTPTQLLLLGLGVCVLLAGGISPLTAHGPVLSLSLSLRLLPFTPQGQGERGGPDHLRRRCPLHRDG